MSTEVHGLVTEEVMQLAVRTPEMEMLSSYGNSPNGWNTSPPTTAPANPSLSTTRQTIS
jgi:hypothetical protein